MSKSKSIGRAYGMLAVGRTGTGKTTFTKTVLSELEKNDPHREIVVYDVNNEFGEFYNEPFLAFESFMESILPLKNSFIHIEEATIFFTSRSTNRALIEKLVRKRHENNIISLNFHSWGQLPKQILDLVDFVTIFKTNDSLKTIKDKTDKPKLISAFESVQRAENEYQKILVDLYARNG